MLPESSKVKSTATRRIINESTDVTTEKESIGLFTDRGFTEYPITTNYSMDGKYSDEKEIEESSSEKHPMFTTYYVCESGDLWTIELVNGCSTAYASL